MKALTLTAAALSALLLLGGCKESPNPAAGSDKAAAVAPTTEAIQAEGTGFTVGSPMSVRTVYVFFDAQCPHCGALWMAAKPLKSQAKFVWMPVRLLNNASETQGATLLAAKDPVAAMDEHEASLLDKRGGITAGSDIDAQKAIVQKNTALFNRFGFASIPTLVAKNVQTGAVVTHEGALPTAELAAFLGLQPPAGQ
jgi:thiol:disulfide interchange protein DsbG